MRGLDLFKQAAGVDTTTPAYIDSSVSTQHEEAIYTAPVSPTRTIAPVTQDNVYNSGGTDWWNSFMNAIDEIDKSNYQGKRLPYDKEINEYKRRLYEIQEDLDKGAITKEQAEFEASKLESQIARVQNDEEYKRLNEKIAMQEEDIRTSPVSRDYQHSQHESELEENTSMYKYLKYELPKEMGGSASEIGMQLATAYGPKLINSIIKKAAGSAMSGPAAPYIIAGLTAAEIGAGF